MISEEIVDTCEKWHPQSRVMVFWNKTRFYGYGNSPRSAAVRCLCRLIEGGYDIDKAGNLIVTHDEITTDREGNITRHGNWRELTMKQILGGE